MKKINYKPLWKLLIDHNLKKERPLQNGINQPCDHNQNGKMRSCYDRRLGTHLSRFELRSQ